ncbi:MAG: outer membrane lipoprotein carrier protein LolA [Desulfuromonas sp.]|nr:outer membrane lipoprotein carrier protein LolA [Desulfuromonas sp.]
MRTVILFVISLLISPLWASASDISAIQLMERLQQRFTADGAAQTIQDVQADFFQKASIASLNRVQTGRGTMAMAFDHSGSSISSTLFHWIYAVPNQQQVISDGKTLWVYLPDNNQVMVSEVNDKSYYSEDPLLFLRNLGQLSSHFAVQFAPMEPSTDVKPEYYQLLLTPLQPSVYIQSLQLEVPLWLGSAPQQLGFPLHSATIIDPTGNKTQLEFRNVKINQHLALDQFSFTVPAGVDVVNPADLTLDFK